MSLLNSRNDWHLLIPKTKESAWARYNLFNTTISKTPKHKKEKKETDDVSISRSTYRKMCSVCSGKNSFSQGGYNDCAYCRNGSCFSPAKN